MKLLICCILLSFSLPGFAKGDPKAGQNKALVCSACHGADGHSTNPQWPNLAGQYASYLVQQLHYYQSGDKRSSPIMSPLVTNLTCISQLASPVMVQMDAALSKQDFQ